MELVFIIQAHQGKTPDMQLLDVCTLELFCATAKEAIARAKKIIKKDHYRVSQIIEKESKCQT